ncbi:hypothetical protein SH449x_000636 [Pirellulaceae bacterium SH449]
MNTSIVRNHVWTYDINVAELAKISMRPEMLLARHASVGFLLKLIDVFDTAHGCLHRQVTRHSLADADLTSG